mmetsp:Transcript_15071/g.41912  ORF Transcript_15071/g.41912 Transcript_15071/m.41912 type:complete len:212 (-) Transcript_15071:1847-2482(-)
MGERENVTFIHVVGEDGFQEQWHRTFHSVTRDIGRCHQEHIETVAVFCLAIHHEKRVFHEAGLHRAPLDQRCVDSFSIRWRGQCRRIRQEAISGRSKRDRTSRDYGHRHGSKRVSRISIRGNKTRVQKGTHRRGYGRASFCGRDSDLCRMENPANGAKRLPTIHGRPELGVPRRAAELGKDREGRSRVFEARPSLEEITPNFTHLAGTIAI